MDAAFDRLLLEENPYPVIVTTRRRGPSRIALGLRRSQKLAELPGARFAFVTQYAKGGVLALHVEDA